MEAKERYIIFGLGFLIGCLVLAYTSSGKYRAIQEQKQTDALNGYMPSKAILPGQDLSARKPFDTGPALAKKDFPLASDQTFLRILIAKGNDPSSALWRIEETLWKDPSSEREKLISRVIMHADQIIVRLKEGSDDPIQLSKDLEPLNIKVLSNGRGPRLYRLQLPSQDLDAVPNAISLLASSISSIEKAFPSYI